MKIINLHTIYKKLIFFLIRIFLNFVYVVRLLNFLIKWKISIKCVCVGVNSINILYVLLYLFFLNEASHFMV